MSTTITTIDLLRHGEPEGADVFRGLSDFTLTEKGWQQLRDATSVRPAPWHTIITSPLRRCSDFAHELATEIQCSAIIEAKLHEMSFGDWEGQNIEVIKQQHPELIKKFAADPSLFTPPNGENLQQLAQRVLPVWNEIIERHRGQHVLIVAHGGVNRIILADILDIPHSAVGRLEVPYAGMSRIQIFHNDKYEPLTRLVFHNSIPQ